MDELREAFEAWVRRARPKADLALKGDGDYRSQAVRNQWEAFQAGAAHVSGVQGTFNDQGEKA